MENNLPPVHPPAPPLITPPPLSRPPRRGRGWMILSLFLAVVLIVLVVFELARNSVSWSLASGTGRQSGRLLEEVVVENNGSGNKIAIVDVEGIITSMGVGRRGRNMVDLIEDQLKMAARDSSVRAVILKVDSPGGEVMASDDISRALLEFQQRQHRP